MLKDCTWIAVWLIVLGLMAFDLWALGVGLGAVAVLVAYIVQCFCVEGWGSDYEH